MPQIPRSRWPLRPIEKLKVQAGKHVVVMKCGHAEIGRPEDPRRARFFRCGTCAKTVAQHRRAHAARSREVRP